MLRALAPLCLAALLSAQTPPAPTAPPLAWLPANTTSLLVVHDVLPHLQAIVASPVFDQLVAATRPLQEQDGGTFRDAAAVRRMVKPFEGQVPREFGIALPTAFWDRVVDVAVAVTDLGLLKECGAGALGADAVKDLSTAAEEAITAIRQLDGLVWVEARDERIASQWFEAVAGLVRGLDAVPGLTFTSGDGVLTAKANVRGLAGGEIVSQLEKMGLDLDGRWDPTFVATLRLDGARLVLQFGKRGDGAFDGKALAGFDAPRDPPLLMWCTDSGDNLERLAELQEQIMGVIEAATEPEVAAAAGKAYVSLQRLVDRMGRHRGSLRLAPDLLWTSEEVFDSSDDEIEPAADVVLRCVRGDGEPHLVTAAPFDFVGAGLFDQLVSGLESRGVDLPPLLEELNDFFAGEDSAQFAPGTLVTGRVAQFRGAEGWKHGPMPFAAVGVVAKAHDDAAAGTFMALLSERIARGLQLGELPWKATDLGPGVEGHVLDLAACAPFLAPPQVDWDFAPNWCVVDGVLVLTTEPALTKDLVARLRGETKASGGAKDSGVMTVRMTGATWQAVAAGMAQWSALVPMGGMEEMLSGVFRATAAMAEQIDTFEWRLDEDGSVLRDVLRVRWKPAK